MADPLMSLIDGHSHSNGKYQSAINDIFPNGVCST